MAYKEKRKDILKRLEEDDIVEIEFFDNTAPNDNEFKTEEWQEDFMKKSSIPPISIVGYVAKDYKEGDRYINLYQMYDPTYGISRIAKILICSIDRIKILRG